MTNYHKYKYIHYQKSNKMNTGTGIYNYTPINPLIQQINCRYVRQWD